MYEQTELDSKPTRGKTKMREVQAYNSSSSQMHFCSPFIFLKETFAHH
jgi:hypothetical protein